LPNNKLFPIPIYFDVSKEDAKLIEKSRIVEVKDFNNRTKGFIHVNDIYVPDKEWENKHA